MCRLTEGLSGCYGFSSPLLRSVFLSRAVQCIDTRLEQLAVCHTNAEKDPKKLNSSLFLLVTPKKDLSILINPVIGLLGSDGAH